jgi:ABC-2 type transport system permease protein
MTPCPGGAAGTYFQWPRLAPVKIGPLHWLKTVVPVNPLLHVNESMRAAFTPVPLIHPHVIYRVAMTFRAGLPALGLHHVGRRVLS